MVNNLMHVPIGRRASKTKVVVFPDLRFGVGELWVPNGQHNPFLQNLENHRCTTSDTFLFTESLMGINRSCYYHIALITLVTGSGGFALIENLAPDTLVRLG